jgi:lipopolysaccharide export system protein LptA
MPHPRIFHRYGWNAALAGSVGVVLAGGSLAAAPQPAPIAAPPPATKPPATKPPGTKPPPGALGSSNLPLDISSENSEQFQQEHRAVWWGNVEAIQGQSRLRTPRLTAFFTPRDPNAPKPAPGTIGPDSGQVERVEAEGPVYYVTPTQKAKGDHATYLASTDTITMTGNVVLVQDKDVATGDTLVIEQKSGHATLTSNPSKGGGQRVRAVLYPSETNQAGTAGAAAGSGKPAGRP